MLCGPESDLDLTIDIDFQSANVNTIMERLGANSFSHFISLFPERRNREVQILRLLVSPALDSVITTKREIFNTQVPIVRCLIPSPVED